MSDQVEAPPAAPPRPRCPKCGEWRWLRSPGEEGNPFRRRTFCIACRCSPEYIREAGQARRHYPDFDPEDVT